MTRRELTGFRDQAYSAWHRSLSDSLSFMDIDWIEWCKTCYRPLALYELAVDNGAQDGKQTWVTRKIATSAGLKGFLVLYAKDQRGFVSGFRVRQLAPVEATEFTSYTLEAWAQFLYGLRWCHPISRTTRLAVLASGPRCATCGGQPDGTYRDGSPHFTCIHPAVYGTAS